MFVKLKFHNHPAHAVCSGETLASTDPDQKVYIGNFEVLIAWERVHIIITREILQTKDTLI